MSDKRTDQSPAKKLENAGRHSGWATLGILVGVILETVNLAKFPENKPPIEITVGALAYAVTLISVAWSFLCIRQTVQASGALQRETDEMVAQANAHAAEANERAATADLARMELERKLAPRELTQDQFDALQELKGQFEIINVAYETDAETWWFANSIISALVAAGIRVGQFRRAAEVHSFGTLLYEPGALKVPIKEGVLAAIFRKVGLFASLALISHPPPDIAAPLDAPLIIVGGRFILPPSRPYIWEPKPAGLPETKA